MQRLVVAQLERLSCRLPRRQSTLRRAEKYQPPKPKTRNRAETLRRPKTKSRARPETPRGQKPKAPHHDRNLPTTEAPTRVLASNATELQRPKYFKRMRQRRALRHNGKAQPPTLGGRLQRLVVLHVTLCETLHKSTLRRTSTRMQVSATDYSSLRATSSTRSSLKV